MMMTRYSTLCVNTLRDIPSEAEVISHQLLLRAGYIRRLAAGIYSYLPLMWRVLNKVSHIVREEMNRADAQELMMPIMQPAELWQETGRWDVYGGELIRLKDRHERDMVLAPTHEEVITSIARSEYKSYKKLPANLYQIQFKYRDERRPRFGLLRGREFIMKDAYSFHRTQEDLEREYEVMANTYDRIFKRCGLETRMVRSDSGAIGGSVSHEFMVLTPDIEEGKQQSGENDVFYCTHCHYSANSNQAQATLQPINTDGSDAWPEEKDLPTPGATSIVALHETFGIRPEIILKTLVFMVNDTQAVVVLIRGDLDVEEVQLQNALLRHFPETFPMIADIRLANSDELYKLTGSSKGFIGPVNLPEGVPVIAENSTLALKHFAVALNEPGIHRVGANWGSTLPLPTVHDQFFFPRVGDGCPQCEEGTLLKTRGIEVGNIFQLGTKYSEQMNAVFMDEDGQEKPFIMGCYGIGVSRVAAAAVERCHDASGICWPMPIAPFQVAVVPVNTSDATQNDMAERLYTRLKHAGVEVLIDDRDERAGVKFKDIELIGIPLRVTVGKLASEWKVELKARVAGSEAQVLTEDDLVAHVVALIASSMTMGQACET
ncbi:MAG: proline--tRNA ligase [Vampirovibrionales bacterium]